MSIDDEIKAEQKLHPALSKAFIRLEQIFVARYQPWCEINFSTRQRLVRVEYTDADLRNAVHELHQDEVARALVRACIHGDLRIAKLLWSARGPVTFEHESRALMEIINGSVVRLSTEADHTLTNLESAQELQELMEWMPTVGLGFMVGLGAKPGFLLASDDMAFAIKNLSWTASFEGTLPTLADGVVNQPELMLALQQKGEGSAYKQSFGDILVWATPQMLKEFPEQLAAFRSRQGLVLESTTKEPGKDPELKDIKFDQCDESLMSQLSRVKLVGGGRAEQHGAWKLYQFDLALEPANRYDRIRDDMVVGYLATLPMQLGFDQKPDHVLCRTHVDFLSQFSMGPIGETNLKAALDFTKDYFPLDIVTLDNGPDKTKIYGSCVRPSQSLQMGNGAGGGTNATFRLFRLMGDDSAVKDRLRETLSRPLVQYLIDLYPQAMMDTQPMLALYQAFGMDNKGLVMKIEAEDLQRLHEAGFRFASDTVTRIPAKSGPRGYEAPYVRQSGEHTDVFMNLNNEFIRAGSKTGQVLPDYLLNSYTNAVKMGLWPSETTKPKSLSDALVMASRRKNWGDSNAEMALKAYIDVAGVEACVHASKSDAHWMFIDRHFGREALTPYLKLTSRLTRGRLLENDLGM